MCICIHCAHEYIACRGQKRGAASPWIGVASCCEMPDVGAGNPNPGRHLERRVDLPAELVLQTRYILFIKLDLLRWGMHTTVHR